jgi:molybdopterin-guanine dinucleotide biosynthesis protein A
MSESVTAPRRLAGLVLCGGASTRMGREKALLPVEGRPLVLHVAGLLERAADPVYLGPGRLGRLGELGYREVEDATPGSGPLGGLVAGLAASPHPLLAVLAVDMPFASPELFTYLADLYRGEDAVVPLFDSRPEPLHAVYARSALPALQSSLAEGELALHSALERLRVRWVDKGEWRRADPSGRFAFNLNIDDDFARFQETGRWASAPED